MGYFFLFYFIPEIFYKKYNINRKMVQEAQLVFLDTRHSLDPTIPSDCQFELNFQAANDLTNYTMSMESVSFPNAVYPINKHNNKIYFRENGGPILTATLVYNNYTGAEFATQLSFQMTASGTSSYTIIYDSQSKKLTIDSGADNTQLVDGSNNTYDEMGYNVDTDISTILIADYPIRLDGSQYIDVVSTIGNLNYSSNGRTNILARIPILSGFGSIVYYENDSDDLLELVQYDMVNVEIRLLDDKGNLWDLPANSNISYVFKLVKLV